MKKFSVIGANSSIARNFSYYLKGKDVELKLYDIQPESIDGEQGYTCINLLDEGDIDKIDYDCDAIFIYSGLTGGERSINMHSAFIDVNEKSLLNILKAHREKNSRARIIYPSSRLVYKNSNEPLTEESPKEGLSVYAVNKIAAEGYIRMYNSLYGTEYTIFRIAIPFGNLNPASTDYGIVSKFRHQAQDNGAVTVFGDGCGRRTFTHIKDICRLIYEGAISHKTLNETYNIGGCTYSLLELANLQAERFGARVTTVEWPELVEKIDVPNGDLDSTKLDSIFGKDYIDIVKYIKEV